MPVRRHVLAAVGWVMALVVLGVALGVVWYSLAPGQLSVVLRDGTAAPLPTESNHRFDAVALFALMGLGVGLVSGTALWQWRSQRGPVLLAGGAAASLLSAWLAYRCGLALTGSPGELGPAGTLVTLPPILGSAIVIVAQPLGAILAYVVAVSFNSDDDLGRFSRSTDELSSRTTVS